uniref:SUMO1 activating enzyme subunit 1 n=2 Tax=Nothoprocta perdicaria TaxID=30464 RepID=A0A8C6Z9M4_NOTPE
EGGIGEVGRRIVLFQFPSPCSCWTHAVLPRNLPLLPPTSSLSLERRPRNCPADSWRRAPAPRPQVCLTCCSRDAMVRIDQLCRQSGVKFFAGDVFGYHGYAFADLGEHEFVEEKTKVAKGSPAVEDGPDTKKAKLEPAETTMVKKRAGFCPLKEALAVEWSGEKARAALRRTAPDYFLLQVLLKFRTDKGRDPSPQSYGEDSKLLLQIRGDVLDALGVGTDLLPDDFPSYCFSEMAPVCAVVGGVLGQEVVKALSQRDPPHNNFFFFDGIKGNGVVERLGAK